MSMSHDRNSSRTVDVKKTEEQTTTLESNEDKQNDGQLSTTSQANVNDLAIPDSKMEEAKEQKSDLESKESLSASDYFKKARQVWVNKTDIEEAKAAFSFYMKAIESDLDKQTLSQFLAAELSKDIVACCTLINPVDPDNLIEAQPTFFHDLSGRQKNLLAIDYASIALWLYIKEHNQPSKKPEKKSKISNNLDDFDNNFGEDNLQSYYYSIVNECAEYGQSKKAYKTYQTCLNVLSLLTEKMDFAVSVRLALREKLADDYCISTENKKNCAILLLNIIKLEQKMLQAFKNNAVGEPSSKYRARLALTEIEQHRNECKEALLRFEKMIIDEAKIPVPVLPITDPVFNTPASPEAPQPPKAKKKKKKKAATKPKPTEDENSERKINVVNEVDANIKKIQQEFESVTDNYDSSTDEVLHAFGEQIKRLEMLLLTYQDIEHQSSVQKRIDDLKQEHAEYISYIQDNDDLSRNQSSEWKTVERPLPRPHVDETPHRPYVKNPLKAIDKKEERPKPPQRKLLDFMKQKISRHLIATTKTWDPVVLADLKDSKRDIDIHEFPKPSEAPLFVAEHEQKRALVIEPIPETFPSDMKGNDMPFLYLKAPAELIKMVQLLTQKDKSRKIYIRGGLLRDIIRNKGRIDNLAFHDFDFIAVEDAKTIVDELQELEDKAALAGEAFICPNRLRHVKALVQTLLAMQNQKPIDIGIVCDPDFVLTRDYIFGCDFTINSFIGEVNVEEGWIKVFYRNQQVLEHGIAGSLVPTCVFENSPVTPSQWANPERPLRGAYQSTRPRCFAFRRGEKITLPFVPWFTLSEEAIKISSFYSSRITNFNRDEFYTEDRFKAIMKKSRHHIHKKLFFEKLITYGLSSSFLIPYIWPQNVVQAEPALPAPSKKQLMFYHAPKVAVTIATLFQGKEGKQDYEVYYAGAGLRDIVRNKGDSSVLTFKEGHDFVVLAPRAEVEFILAQHTDLFNGEMDLVDDQTISCQLNLGGCVTIRCLPDFALDQYSAAFKFTPDSLIATIIIENETLYAYDLTSKVRKEIERGIISLNPEFKENVSDDKQQALSHLIEMVNKIELVSRPKSKFVDSKDVDENKAWYVLAKLTRGLFESYVDKVNQLTLSDLPSELADMLKTAKSGNYEDRIRQVMHRMKIQPSIINTLLQESIVAPLFVLNQHSFFQEVRLKRLDPARFPALFPRRNPRVTHHVPLSVDEALDILEAAIDKKSSRRRGLGVE
jgi:hypothetical protein